MFKIYPLLCEFTHGPVNIRYGEIKDRKSSRRVIRLRVNQYLDAVFKVQLYQAHGMFPYLQSQDVFVKPLGLFQIIYRKPTKCITFLERIFTMNNQLNLG